MSVLNIIKIIWRKGNSLTNGRMYLIFMFFVRIIIIPMSYFLWLVEPFLKVRFHRGQITRIGHLSCYFEVLIRSKEIDILNKRRLHFFIVRKNSAANHTLYNMWKKKLLFIESNILDFIYHQCIAWLNNRRHFGPWHVEHGSLLPSKPTLEFSKPQTLKANETLKHIGIENNDWFVCLHNRSPMYLKEKFPDDKWQRHDIRDCKFQNLYDATKLIGEKGGKCIRMSSGEKVKLDQNAPSNIIDYAFNYQSDFMDIFFPAKCKFLLGPQSGLLNVSLIFNVPVAATNVVPLNCAFVPSNSLFIPKLLWYKEDKRFLSYNEILRFNLSECLNMSNFHSKGIEVVENDSDDIKLLTLDMFDLLSNKKLSYKEEKTINNFMKKYFKEYKFLNKVTENDNFTYAGKISWRFLLKHSYLMDNK